jgi:hypothetical protein
MRRPWISGVMSGIALTMAGAVWSAETTAESTAKAMRFASGSPELRTLAEAWRDHGDDLLRAFASADKNERQGAAVIIGELRSQSGIKPERLLQALIACSDEDACRWAGRALVGRTEGLPAAELLKLADQTLVLRLLADQADAAVMNDAAVVARLRQWLSAPASAEATALLIAQRGSLATWGRPLVETISLASKRGVDGNDTIAVAHQALCVLTRTQRGLASYAGHYDLLVADWSDALAAAKAAPMAAVDSQVADAIARLPDSAALMALLQVGPSALPAIEQAMSGVDKNRRKELAPAARLVARAVTLKLYKTVGDVGLTGIDGERVKDRLATFAVVAQAVEKNADAPGLIHLITWLDDADAVVRVAALDRLVRMSDVRKTFGGKWELSDAGLFPAAHCRWRLRRVLTRGTPDEQVAALQLIASLSTKDLADDVAGLLLSPSAMVVDTAMETLGHLDSSQVQAQLVRLISDHAQPVLRRIKALELIGKYSSSSSSSFSSDGEIEKKAGKDVARLRLLEQLSRVHASTEDLALRSAVQKAQFKLVNSTEKRRAIIVEMLAGGAAERHAGMEMIYATVSNPYEYRVGSGNDQPSFIDLALPLLFAADQPALANMAANSIASAMQDTDHRVKALALFDADKKKALSTWCARSDRSWPYHLALGIALKVVDHDRALPLLKALAEGDAYAPWREHVLRAKDPLEVLRDALAAQPQDGPLPAAVTSQILTYVTSQALTSPVLLPQVLAAGGLDALPGSAKTDYGSDSGSGNERVVTKVYTLSDGQTLTLVGKQRPGGDEESFSYNDETMTWSVQGVAPSSPDADGLAAMTRLLGDLRVGKHDTVHHALVLALISGQEPPRTLEIEIGGNTELWKILAVIHPTIRPQIIAAFSKGGEMNRYYVQKFIVLGNPDLLPVVMSMVATMENKYEVEQMIPYLSSLEVALVEPHIATLLTSPAANGSEKVKALVKKIGRVPLAAALTVVGQGLALEGKITPYTEADAASLTTALSAMTPAVILATSSSLRIIRDTAPLIFDRVMAVEAARQDANGAAWLRTGLPLQAGMRPLYDQALLAKQPDIWLVGAAIALKEKRLDAPGFMARAVELPAESLKDAALVAARYLQGKLNDQETQLAQIFKRAPGSALASWMPLLPPTEAIAKAIAERVKDPLVADQLGFALAALLRANDEWKTLMPLIVPAAGGRLEFLLPAP